jgi:hypothetical protein
MTIEEIRYALTKQLSTVHSLATSYGSIELDTELKLTIQTALKPILIARLNQMETNS